MSTMFSSSVIYVLLTASLFGSGGGFVVSPGVHDATVTSATLRPSRPAGGCSSSSSSGSSGCRRNLSMAMGSGREEEGAQRNNRRRRRVERRSSCSECPLGKGHLQPSRRARRTRIPGVGGAGGDEAARSSSALQSSACPAGDEYDAAASAWQRSISADEDNRLRAEWLVGDSGPTSSPIQPWELRSLSPEEQVSHLNRGLLQLSATFGWCVTDTEAIELDGFNRKVLADASYLTPVEQNWVGVAVQVAYHAHQGQRRKSGEPFIGHPVEVMGVLAGLRMDAETLVAGLLHDTVEDTRLAFADIEAHFGSTVRKIVEGETKLSKIPGRVSAFKASDYEMGGSSSMTPQSSGEGAKQADNLRHMLIAMSKDWRVLVVKVSDRLHNMRTLGAMPAHKQVRIAQETMGVFVPLARRMGLWAIKTELEDRCFLTLHPDEYARVTELLRLRAVSTGHNEQVLEDERRRLEEVLGQSAALEGRAASFQVTVGVKPAYPMWRAMARSDGTLGNVLDCVHFKVAFSLHPQPGHDGVVRSSFENSERERAACYGLLEAAHGLLAPISPPRVEDFVAVPKPNNYRALHSTVLLKGHPVEIQILTDDMDRVAHFGMAASQVARSAGNPKNLPWLAELQTSAEACALGCGDTYSANVRDSLMRAQERRFVFDPQGKILDLAGNATMCDAARELHDSKTCRVAATYVNGRLVPLNRPLKNGDVVAILTAPFLPAKRPQTDPKKPTVEVALHVHTGVWPWSMGAMPLTEEGEPERLMEIDEIPHMTKGEKRLAREVELRHARLSMIAVVAWIAVEVERVSGLAMHRADVFGAIHESPFVYFSSLSPKQAVRTVMVGGVMECGFLMFNAIQDRLEAKEAWKNRPAVTAPEKAMQERKKLHARKRELHNGRLAMVAVACLSLQSVLSGEDSLARLLGLF